MIINPQWKPKEKEDRTLYGDERLDLTVDLTPFQNPNRL